MCDDGCPNVPAGGKGSQRLSTGSILLIVYVRNIFAVFSLETDYPCETGNPLGDSCQTDNPS